MLRCFAEGGDDVAVLRSEGVSLWLLLLLRPACAVARRIRRIGRGVFARGGEAESFYVWCPERVVQKGARGGFVFWSLEAGCVVGVEVSGEASETAKVMLFLRFLAPVCCCAVWSLGVSERNKFFRWVI